jgi:hypothetical protein
VILIVCDRESYKSEMGFTKILEDAVCLGLFDGGNVGVRRRQLERIMRAEEYDAWGATY